MQNFTAFSGIIDSTQQMFSLPLIPQLDKESNPSDPGAALGYDSLVKTSFEKLCEQNSGVWTQSTAIRAGAVLSSNMMTGCTRPAGTDHFTDVTEYSYFLNKPVGAAEHHHH